MLLFEDETELHYNPSIQKTWQPQGIQKKILAAGKDRRVCVFGAMNYHKREEIHYQISESKKSEKFVEFLGKLLSFYHKKIYLVLDNFCIHSAKKVAQFLQPYKEQIEFVFLPTYSPHLNIMENFWKHLKKDVASNYLYDSVQSMKDSIHNFFFFYQLKKPEIIEKELNIF